MSANVQHHFVEALLKSSRDVAMIVGDFRVRSALRNQVLFQVAPRSSVGLAVLALFVQAQDGNLDRAVVEEFDGLLEEMAIARGISIGRQTHDLVFVGIEIEAQVQRDERNTGCRWSLLR